MRQPRESFGSPGVELLESRTLLAAPAGFESRGPGGGGAFFAPSFSPFNAGEVYASSDMSGLYRSTNFGVDWDLQDFREVQANRASVVQFTSSANVLYTVDQSELPQGGAYNVPTKSTDGGATWTPMTSSWPSDETYSLHADPASTTKFIASDYDQLYISASGGSSFALRYTAPSADGLGLHVAGAFFDGNNIYVGTNRGLLRSSDGGATFSIAPIGGIPAGQAMLSFAAAKQGAVTRLFCVTVPAADLYAGVLMEEVATSFQGIYSLDVGQASWTSRSAGVPAGTFPAIVSMARSDVSTVYVAGASTAGAPSVIKSSNAGANWSNVLTTANNGNVATGWQGAGGDRSWGYGELAMAFTVAPNNPNTLAFTDYGFLHLSTDGGATWRQAYVDPADQNPANSPTPKHKAYRGVGFEDTSALWMHWASPTRVIAGYTDITGVVSSDGGASWAFPTFNPQQNTFYQVSAAPSGTLYAASSSVHDLYQSTYLTDARIDGGTGRVMFSTNQGDTWNTLHDFAHPVIYTAVDPNNSNRMYASVVHSTQGGIFVTNNLSAGAASTWTKLTNPPRTEGHAYNIKVLSDGTLVVSYAARRTSAGVFTASSGVFVSTNGGQSWIDRTASGMTYWTKDIAIDPTDPAQNTWYAAVRSGFGGTGNGTGGLYKSTNRGVNWTRIFSTDSAESLAIAPSSGDIYLATLSGGLWYSAGGADDATPSFTQLDYPFRQVNRVFLNPNDQNEVWVASFGYGLAVGHADAGLPSWLAPGSAATWNAAAHTLTVTGPATITADPGVAAAPLINVSGAGAQLTMAPTSGHAVHLESLDLSNGATATLASVGAGRSPANHRVLVVDAIDIDASSTLDLADNDMIVNETSLALVQPLLAAGYADGSGGIVSSAATNDDRFQLALAENGALSQPFGSAQGGPLFAGQEVAESALLIKFTWFSDLDLDGLVTFGDLSVFNTSYDNGASSGRRWVEGDRNYDGLIDFQDLSLFNTGYDTTKPQM